MRQCIKCGAVLSQYDEHVCPHCGANQPVAKSSAPKTTYKSHPENNDYFQDSNHQHSNSSYADEAQTHYVEHIPHGESSAGTKTKAKGKNKKVIRTLLIVWLVLLALLLGACFSVNYLHNTFNVDNMLNTFSTALLANDTKTLQGMITGNEITVTTDGLNALCGAFSTQDAVNRLTAQLKAEVSSSGQSAEFSAISIESSGGFLGYKSYQIVAKPVSILVNAPAQNILLDANGVRLTGSMQSDGTVVYSGMFPGKYSFVVTGQTLLNENVAGTATEITLLNTEQAQSFDGAMPIANINISGCVSDDAVIFVNNTQVDIRPSGHIVSLPRVLVGSTISMQYTTEYGANITASVQFTDKAQTQLAFENHTTSGGIPEQSTLESILSSFYASYLDAMNNQDINKVNSATETLKGRMQYDVTSEDAKAYVYSFESASVNTANIEQGLLDNDTPILKMNCWFKYKTTKKDGGDENEHTMFYTAELVYMEGSWKVNRLAQNSQIEYDNGTLAELA